MCEYVCAQMCTCLGLYAHVCVLLVVLTLVFVLEAVASVAEAVVVTVVAAVYSYSTMMIHL